MVKNTLGFLYTMEPMALASFFSGLKSPIPKYRVKNILLALLLSTGLHAYNIFERNCIQCHQTLPITLQEMFKHYLLVYSGENNVKAGIRHYLLYPSKDISVMSKLFITTYPIKHKTPLSSDNLDKAIDIYWDTYKVFGKLQ